MNPLVIIFVLTGIVMVIIGYVLSRQLPLRSKHHARASRRTAGHFLIILSPLPFALAFITQFYTSKDLVVEPDVSTHQEYSFATNETKSAPAPLPVPAKSPPAPDQSDIAAILRQSINFLRQNRPDEALDKANAALVADPHNWACYFVRGNVYAITKQWDLAEQDYLAAEKMNDQNSAIKYNLADIQFAQKKYALARPGFAHLANDQELGDQATYKVFLCDLFGGYEDNAAKDLANINQTGANASYYFANAAWSLYHQKTDDANGWLNSARKIYPPAKFQRYSASLEVLGYTEHEEAPSLLNAPASVPAVK
jgi:Tfp pilus assembly protein PilF